MTKSLPIAAALLLCACASSGGYGPQTASGGLGYAEQKIETARYRVSYRARNAAAAENGALRRAAELTLAQGFESFTVVSRDIDTLRDRSGSSIGIGGGTGGRRSGVGVGVTVPLGGTREEVSVNLQIVMSDAPKGSDPREYDAEETLRNLSSFE
ncbi:MAG: hypothetical protein V2I43_13670 [Parvularcula sp.]|jgi:hypothetical protein|nr:hypothetical protein [Parvularcula sp.]